MRKNVFVILFLAFTMFICSACSFGMLPNHEHSYGDWETVVSSSCLQEGLAKRVCSGGSAETKVLGKLSHEVVVDHKVEATC